MTIHNLAYQSSLMRSARQAILDDTFPSFLTTFFHRFFASPSQIPRWCVDALRSVGVDLFAGLGDEVRGVEGNGVKWEYSARGRKVA